MRSQLNGRSVDFGSGSQRSQPPFAQSHYLWACSGAVLYSRTIDKYAPLGGWKQKKEGLAPNVAFKDMPTT